jgi:hypothetical protein
MSYAVQQPVAEAPRRPVTVGLAAVLLAVMGVGGLAYAVATLAVTPGVVDRFRQAAASADNTAVDGLVTVVWVLAAVGTVLAVILFALYIVLALGLRRGSNASRVGVWVLSGLGLLAGCGTTVTVLVEQSGSGGGGGLGNTLAQSYPGNWVGLNLTLAIAQIVGYAVVAVLLMASPGLFFGRGAQRPATPTYAAIPPYGASSPYGQPGYAPQPGYGQHPGYGQPGYAAPVSGPSGASFGYGSPSGFERPVEGQSPGGLTPQDPAGRPPPSPAASPQPGPDDDFWSRPSE